MAQTRYNELMKLRDQDRERIARSTVCVKGKETPWETNPQGIMKWYMHPCIDTTAHKFLIFAAQQIPAGNRSGKQKHQGGVVVVVVEGKGYTTIDGVRYDWKAGDIVQLPIKPEGIVFQHFNSGAEPVLLIHAEPNLAGTVGIDRGCGYEQIEAAPEYPAS